MKKNLFLIPGILTFMLCNLVMANPVGETVSYTLNSDRSTWLIRSGSGQAEVTEYRPNSEFGPGYVVSIDYELNVMLRGKQSGNIGLFVPERVFETEFLSDLENSHPMSLGSFEMDYEGTSNAQDSSGNMYQQCMMTRIFNINHNYRPVSSDGKDATVLWFNHSGSIKYVTGMVIKLKVHQSVDVLGAVQIDISGTSNNGISFEAGLDLIN